MRIAGTVGAFFLVVSAAQAACSKNESPPVEARQPPVKQQETADQPDPLALAVAANARPADDRARDGDRKPVEVMRFFGIEAKQTVADIMGGKGYYTEILSRAVGPDGRVFAQNNEFVLSRFAEGPLSERLQHADLANVTRVDKELDEGGLPKGEVDVALMVLFYHDSYWMKTDRAKMNKHIYDALVPGGIYGVVDHHAEAGTNDRDVKTLHRVDSELVKAEILAAGFEWVGESDLLQHPEDERKANVFDDGIRGKTDRFMFKFRKPESP
jgi:predicted methyltransferase